MGRRPPRWTPDSRSRTRPLSINWVTTRVIVGRLKPKLPGNLGPRDRPTLANDFEDRLFLITIGPLIFLYYISLTDYELGTSLSGPAG